ARMAKVKRATIYLDPTLHRALRIKAAETETSLSDLVNVAVRRSLSEDAADLAVFEARGREPVLPFEAVVKDLKRRGKLYRPHQAFCRQGARGTPSDNSPSGRRQRRGACRDAATAGRRETFRAGEVSDPTRGLSRPLLYR